MLFLSLVETDVCLFWIYCKQGRLHVFTAAKMPSNIRYMLHMGGSMSEGDQMVQFTSFKARIQDQILMALINFVILAYQLINQRRLF